MRGDVLLETNLPFLELTRRDLIRRVGREFTEEVEEACLKICDKASKWAR